MRSLLLVSPDGDGALHGAARAGADALVVDVAGATATTLRRVGKFLAEHRAAPVYVRVSPLASGRTAAELDALVPSRPDGVVLAGAEGGASVTRLSAMLRPREAEAGIADGAIAIIAVAADTPTAVFALGSYRDASPRLAGLVCEPVSLGAALGAHPGSEAVRLARTLTVLGSAAAGVPAIEGPFHDVGDLAGLEAEALAARRDGFRAKFAVHPDQVPVINRVFSLSAASSR